jgi:hypothetical protein
MDVGTTLITRPIGQPFADHAQLLAKSHFIYNSAGNRVQRTATTIPKPVPVTSGWAIVTLAVTLLSIMAIALRCTSARTLPN